MVIHSQLFKIQPGENELKSLSKTALFNNFPTHPYWNKYKLLFLVLCELDFNIVPYKCEPGSCQQ